MPKKDCGGRPEAALKDACAGFFPVVLAVVPPEVPVPVPEPWPLEGVGGVFPLEPEPGAWPGLRLSGAVAASAAKACIVRLPDAGLHG